MAQFDVLVIGSGPGGYVAAIRAAQLGLSAACVEKDRLGGVCLNWGCIPSKALLKSAEYAQTARHLSDYGVNVGEVTIDFPKVIKRSRGVADRSEKGVKFLFKKYGVTSISGTTWAETGDPGLAISIPWDDGEHTYFGSELINFDPNPVSFTAYSFIEGPEFGLKNSIYQENQSESYIYLGASMVLK